MDTEFYRSILSSRRSRRFVAASFVVSSAIGLSATAAQAEECVDSDGDGWGWDGNATCLLDDAEEPTTASVSGASRTASISMCIDSDGDGWGWDGHSSCRIGKAAAGVGYCDDSDGDGWGWDGADTCQSVPLTARATGETVDQPDGQTATKEGQLEAETSDPVDSVEVILAQLDEAVSSPGQSEDQDSESGNQSGGAATGSDEVQRFGNAGTIGGNTGDNASGTSGTDTISEAMQDRYEEGFNLIEEANDLMEQDRFDEARDLLDEAANMRMPIESDEHATLDRDLTTELFGTLTRVDMAERVAEAPIVFGTVEERIAVADAALDDVEQLFATGRFEQANDSLIQAIAVLDQIPEEAARSDVGQRALDLDFQLSSVGLGSAEGRPITPDASAQETFTAAIDELSVAELSLEIGDVEMAWFFMEEAVDTMSGVVDPDDTDLQKEFRNRVFNLAGQINAARYGSGLGITPTETSEIANLAISTLGKEADFAGSLIVRSPGGREVEVHILGGKITQATISQLPLSQEEMAALQAAFEAKRSSIPVGSSLIGTIFGGDTAKQAAATYSGGDLGGEYAGTPITLPDDDGDAEVEESTAQQAAATYSDGDLGGEYAGTPITLPDDSPAPSTPARTESSTPERTDHTSSFDEAAANRTSNANSNDDSKDENTEISTAQQAANIYSDGDLGGEFAGL